MVLAMTSCGKEPEPTKEETQSETVVTVTETQAAQGWEGSYEAADSEEHFKIYDVTDTGFKVEFYHYEEGIIERFDYEMEYDNAEKTMASEIGNADDNGGWEYKFAFGGDSITVSWQSNVMLYKRVS